MHLDSLYRRGMSKSTKPKLVVVEQLAKPRLIWHFPGEGEFGGLLCPYDLTDEPKVLGKASPK